MTSINPLAGALAAGSASTATSRSAGTGKGQQVRRAQALSKNIAADDASRGRQVESADAVTPPHDEDRGSQQGPPKRARKPARAADDSPQIDVKA